MKLNELTLSFKRIDIVAWINQAAKKEDYLQMSLPGYTFLLYPNP